MKKSIKYMITCALIILECSTNSVAQSTKELHVGDRLPDILLQNVYHGNGQPIRLKSLCKGKALLISFWATWCIPCIREMQTLDSISLPFSSKLNLLTVNYQDEITMSKLFNDAHIRPLANRTSVSSDTLMRKYLPYRFLPHNVWVDSTGIIVGITGEEAVTKESLQNLINGHLTFKAVKRDSMTFDMLKPYHDDDSSFTYRSIIGKFDPKLNSGNVKDRYDYKPYYLRKKYFAFNSSLLEIIWYAYEHFFNFQDVNYKRLRIITKDSARFLAPSKFTGFNNPHISLNDWVAQNCFCYEITLPTPVSDTVFGQMVLEDMHRNFKFHSRIEQTEMEGWVISKMPKKLDLPKNDTLSIRIYKEEIDARDITLNDLIDFMEDNCGHQPDPIVNVTGDNRYFDLHLKSGDRIYSMSNVIKMLIEAGFKIERKKVTCNALILSD
ncbi:TlpA family protein disulfide reductase [Mucilaginibacter sp. X4EP1]|uniref:TlpA family protein disulfide reductase n=1 Tax=Mucilaginibacter sp. X4EP1 TaxID=2723092 RepID=UPI00216A1F47|nr:TlpA family protein disulfide reductase [Mucilaginibacter sp. X4EP1]MCS3811502.1 thiol-disulfide isomerase/thioredoxin [Mucilaginibacter sp. X4EP1]